LPHTSRTSLLEGIESVMRWAIHLNCDGVAAEVKGNVHRGCAFLNQCLLSEFYAHFAQTVADVELEMALIVLPSKGLPLPASDGK
jgi:hypothetical protein